MTDLWNVQQRIECKCGYHYLHSNDRPATEAESATFYRLLVGAIASAAPILLGVHGCKLAAQKEHL